MKTSDINKKMNKIIVFLAKVVLVICIALATCGLFNFMLVAPIQTSVLGTIMADVESQNENIDVMLLGSSRTYRGIDAPYLTETLDENVFNIASNSVTYISLYHLLVELCKTNVPDKIFLEVSSVNFKRDTGTEDSYIYQILTGQNQKDYQEAISYDYKENLGIFEFVNYLNNFANGKFTENITYKLNPDKSIGSALNNDKSFYEGHGYSYAEATAEGKEMVLLNSYLTDGDMWDEKDINEKALSYFFKIMDYCQDRNIEIVLYSLPYPKVIIEKYYDEFVSFDNSLKSFIENYSGIEFLDFSKIKQEYMELNIDYFYNANHCNGKGAEVLSPIFREIYSELENGSYSYDKWFYRSYSDLVK